MPVQMKHGDVFEARTDGLLLTVDGTSRGMEGNLARRFAERWPSAWADIEGEAVVPLALGQVQAVDIRAHRGCPFTHVLLASTLHHLGVDDIRRKQATVSSAVADALRTASAAGIATLAATSMKGGWRLTLDQALIAMVQGFRAALPGARGLTLCIYDLDPEIRGVARRLGFP